MKMAERIETLERAGYKVRYADIRKAYQWSDPHVSCWDLHDSPYGDRTSPYVEFGDVASGEDYYSQTTTWQRSNFRRLLQDYGRKLAAMSYTNVDALGAFVVNLDEDLLNLIIGLREQYPIYDEEDMSALEDEEITEAFASYLHADLYRDLPEWWQDIDSSFSDKEIEEAWWECVWAMDQDGGLVEHNGIECVWNDKKALSVLIAALRMLQRRKLGRESA